MTRPLVRLGDISYSLYLSHFFTLALFVRAQEHLPVLGDGFSVVSVLAFLLLAWNVSALCYRFIEEPARVFFAQRKNAMRTAG
jgi:peptidoglycan/LPS O-acetylase OafA/YrhL